MRLQHRDLEIIEAVHRLRVLRTDQVAALFFPSHGAAAVSSACRTRLRYLTAAGYLARLEQPQTRTEGRRPFLFMLTAAGRSVLMEELGYEPEDIDWKPSYNDAGWSYLAHQLAINDVHVAITQAAHSLSWVIERWVDDRFLRKLHVDRVLLPDEDGRMGEVAIVPDAYFVLQASPPPPQLHFFLELDRATMAVAPTSARVKSWRQRIRAYQAYFASDTIVTRYGTRQVRVLTVTTGEKRLAALKTATEEVGGHKRFWFTTTAALTAQSALRGAIWQLAGEAGYHVLVPRP